jgi:hypothetical protein
MATVKLSQTKRINYGITRWCNVNSIVTRAYADDIAYEAWCKELAAEINAEPDSDVAIEYQQKSFYDRHNKVMQNYLECRVASTEKDKIDFELGYNPKPAYNRPDKRSKKGTAA